MFTFISFDVETTGTKPDRDKIIEIGAIKFVNGTAQESFSSFVEISQPIPPEATRIHGITDEMLRGQPKIEDVLEEFTSFCGNSVLVAHNAIFDVKFISNSALDVGVPLPGKLILDTYPLSRRALPDLFNHRLENIVKHFKFEASLHHRALEDSRYCGLALVEIIKLLKKKEKNLDSKKLVQWSGGEIRFPEIAPRARQLGFL